MIDIGKYHVWSCSSGFDSCPDYVDILITKDYGMGTCYVNVQGLIPDLNLTDKNPLFKVNDKENMTIDEREFREEFNAFQSRKGCGMPLTKLSARHAEKLFAVLEREEENDAVIS